MYKVDEKRERIIEAAKECLTRYGFEKTTMSDIGNLVGLNKASLYYYYKNKEELLTEVVFQSTKKFIESLQDKIGEIQGYQKKLTTYLQERLRYFMQVMNLHNLSLDTFKQVQPLFFKIYQVVLDKEVDFISHVLDESIAKKEIQPVDTKRVASSLLMIVDAVKQNMSRGCDNCFLTEADRPRIEEEVMFPVSLILSGLKK